jgi:hypothetical protein
MYVMIVSKASIDGGIGLRVGVGSQFYMISSPFSCEVYWI